MNKDVVDKTIVYAYPSKNPSSNRYTLRYSLKEEDNDACFPIETFEGSNVHKLAGWMDKEQKYIKETGG